MPTDTPSALPNAPQCLSCGRSTISFITAAPFFGCTACGQPWEEKCKLCNRNREAHLREEKRHKNMHTFESPLPPPQARTPPREIMLLIDELGVKAAMVEHVSDYGTEETGRRGREILYGLNKVRDYILAGAESAPQEAGALANCRTCLGPISKCGHSEMLGYFLTGSSVEGCFECERAERGVPLEETKNEKSL